jgi:transporter family-2 protein
VVLDHFGLIGFELHSARAVRIFGCLLMVAGLALIWRFRGQPARRDRRR